MFKNLKLSAIKTAFLALLPLLVHVKFSLVGGAPTIQWPTLAVLFPDFTHFAVAALGYYELVIRLVPSLENNSLISLLGQALEAFVPNHAITDDGGLGVHTFDAGVVRKPGAGPGTGLAVA